MDRIALVPIKGIIVSEEVPAFLSPRVISSVEIIRLLEEVKKTKRAKALVLEINSPGGTPFACKEIAEAVKAVGKPTVAWVRETAASGGYWIASASDVIVADNLSTLGSIGVASIRPDFSGLLKKIGIDIDTISSGVHKLFGLPFKAPTEEEKQKREKEIEILQQAFLSDLKRYRNLSEKAIEEISSGESYFGEEAKNLGLVDQLGGKREAFGTAAKRAGIKAYRVLDYTKRLKKPRRGILGRLLGF